MSEYVVQGAELKCNFGSKSSKLQVPIPHRVSINNKQQANIMDNKPMLNIQPFGQCSSLANPAVAAATAANYGRLQKMPCIPVTIAPWMMGKINVTTGNFPVLQKNSTLMCMWCGMIKIQDSGQGSAPPSKSMGNTDLGIALGGGIATKGAVNNSSNDFNSNR